MLRIISNFISYLKSHLQRFLILFVNKFNKQKYYVFDEMSESDLFCQYHFLNKACVLVITKFNFLFGLIKDLSTCD
jgi:hypothetical protein